MITKALDPIEDFKAWALQSFKKLFYRKNTHVKFPDNIKLSHAEFPR